MSKTNDKPMSKAQALSAYFRSPGQTAKEFMAELKELSADEKAELATLAAAELGVTLK